MRWVVQPLRSSQKVGFVALCIALACGGCSKKSAGPASSGMSGAMQGSVPKTSGTGGATVSTGSAGHAGGAAAPTTGSVPATTATPGTGASTMGALRAQQILRGSCATSTMQSELVPANILFVVDRSGSMNCNLPPTTDSVSCEKMPVRADASLPSKWEVTTTALIEAMKTLPATATVGISYFSNDDTCGVSSTPSVALSLNTSGQQDVMRTSLQGMKPGGGTPLVGATILAYKHLHQLAVAGNITGNEFVVLLTDGEQSAQCSYATRCTDAQSCYDLLVNQEVPKAYAPGVGIRTFVIVAPGSEPARTVLSQIAKNGGTSPAGCDPMLGNCHFDMTRETDFGKALSTALRAIVGQALSCELPLPQSADGGAIDPARVNVIYSPSKGDAAVVQQDVHAGCDAGANGWQYSTAMDRIRLCGSICDTVKADQGGRVDVVLGCPVQQVQ
jgi:Mg-chelatase subunit ChlD